jgi:hypothetical protein
VRNVVSRAYVRCTTPTAIVSKVLHLANQWYCERTQVKESSKSSIAQSAGGRRSDWWTVGLQAASGPNEGRLD